MDRQGKKCDIGNGPDRQNGQNGAMYLQWFREIAPAGKAKGKTQAGLAKALGLDPTAITRMKQGKRRIQADEVPTIAAYYGVEIPGAVGRQMGGNGVPSLLGKELMGVPMRGALEAGRFRPIEDDIESGLPKRAVVSIPSNYRGQRLNAWLVRGDSMDGRGIVDGDTVISAETIDEGWKPETGQCVVVERCLDGAEIERTVKEVHVFQDRIELRPNSSNPTHRTITVPIDRDPEAGGMEVTVIGRVIKVEKDL